MSSIFASLGTNLFRKVQGSAFIMPFDPVTFIPTARLSSQGSAAAEMDIKGEYIDYRENQSPLRSRLDSRCVQSDVTLKLSLMQYTTVMLAAAHQASMGYNAQTADANGSITLGTGAAAPNDKAIVDGDVIELLDPTTGAPLLGCTGITVTDGATALPAATVRIDADSGLVQIVKAPASGTVTITFSAPTEAAPSRSQFNLLNLTNFTARVVIRQNNLDGQNLKYVFPKMQIRAPSSFKLIGNDNTNITTEFDCIGMYDTRYPGQEMGWVTYVK